MSSNSRIWRRIWGFALGEDYAGKNTRELLKARDDWRKACAEFANCCAFECEFECTFGCEFCDLKGENTVKGDSGSSLFGETLPGSSANEVSRSINPCFSSLFLPFPPAFLSSLSAMVSGLLFPFDPRAKNKIKRLKKEIKPKENKHELKGQQVQGKS